MTSFLRFGALMAAAGCAAAAGCGSSGPTGDTAFGLGVLGALCSGHQNSNAVISPVSLATGLDMAYLGARGATATAIARMLHLPPPNKRDAAEFAARSALLRSLGRPGVTFTASDRIWADPSLQTRHAYVTAVRSAQGAGLTPLPLLSRPEQSRRRINAAIARGTRGHLPHLLPPGSLARPPAGWVLTDVLYLNARWQQPFNHALTAKSAFHAASGPVSVSYMNGGSFATAHADGWTAVALPYRGGRLSMIAALPPAGTAGCRLPDTATVGALAGRLASSRSLTAVSLPRVKLSASESMRDVLTKLGMGIAFGGAADFSGLSSQACCIGSVQHAATLAVQEKGTVASAATAIGMEPTAAHITLSFDRPYLLILRDTRTGEPLMLARVANPAS